jgi:L-seryl-tRNA(Ser) seleniumtransferase
VFYTDLGVRTLINAATTLTAIGGSIMPPEVHKAMREASTAFVDMHDLHERAGARLARVTKNEAAYVTSGCSAAIVLAVLGCRTRGVPSKIAQLGSAGNSLPDEVVMHAAHRIPYDPAIQLAGGTIRQVGNALQTFEWELEAAISSRTAAVFWVAGSHLSRGALPLPNVVRIAHSMNVPVIVDAAAQLPPVSNLWRFTVEQGADIALFSGGKALRGPQASGLMVGRRELVEAARANGSPHQRFARALKAGKEEIAGLVAAVCRYVELDHKAISDEHYAVCSAWASGLAHVPGVTTTIEDANTAGQPVPRVRVDLDDAVPAKGGGVTQPWHSSEVIAKLRAGEPSIIVGHGAEGSFYLGPELVTREEAAMVLSRVLHELSPSQV